MSEEMGMEQDRRPKWQATTYGFTDGIHQHHCMVNIGGMTTVNYLNAHAAELATLKAENADLRTEVEWQARLLVDGTKGMAILNGEILASRQENRALQSQLEAASRERDEARKERDHWKANHEQAVRTWLATHVRARTSGALLRRLETEGYRQVTGSHYMRECLLCGRQSFLDGTGIEGKSVHANGCLLPEVRTHLEAPYS